MIHRQSRYHQKGMRWITRYCLAVRVEHMTAGISPASLAERHALRSRRVVHKISQDGSYNLASVPRDPR